MVFGSLKRACQVNKNVKLINLKKFSLLKMFNISILINENRQVIIYHNIKIMTIGSIFKSVFKIFMLGRYIIRFNIFFK